MNVCQREIHFTNASKTTSFCSFPLLCITFIYYCLLQCEGVVTWLYSCIQYTMWYFALSPNILAQASKDLLHMDHKHKHTDTHINTLGVPECQLCCSCPPPPSLSSLQGDLQPSPSLFLKHRSPNPAGSLHWSQHTAPAYPLPDAHCPLPQPHTKTTTLYTLYLFLPPFESY